MTIKITLPISYTAEVKYPGKRKTQEIECVAEEIFEFKEFDEKETPIILSSMNPTIISKTESGKKSYGIVPTKDGVKVEIRQESNNLYTLLRSDFVSSIVSKKYDENIKKLNVSDVESALKYGEWCFMPQKMKSGETPEERELRSESEQKKRWLDARASVLNEIFSSLGLSEKRQKVLLFETMPSSSVNGKPSEVSKYLSSKDVKYISDDFAENLAIKKNLIDNIVFINGKIWVRCEKPRLAYVSVGEGEDFIGEIVVSKDYRASPLRFDLDDTDVAVKVLEVTSDYFKVNTHEPKIMVDQKYSSLLNSKKDIDQLKNDEKQIFLKSIGDLLSDMRSNLDLKSKGYLQAFAELRDCYFGLFNQTVKSGVYLSERYYQNCKDVDVSSLVEPMREAMEFLRVEDDRDFALKHYKISLERYVEMSEKYGMDQVPSQRI